MQRKFKQNKEKGAVSMLTVIFFVLFLSVVSVSLLRVVNDERQRSLMNELSASALATAEAGIEDGKRILLYCMNNAHLYSTNSDIKEACSTLSKKEDCSDVINAFSADKLGIIQSNESHEGVIDEGDYQQYYTCMFIDQFTEDVEFALSAVDSKSPNSTASVVIPFDLSKQDSDGNYNTADAVTSFQLRWHLMGQSNDGYSDGGAKTLNSATSNNNPKKTDWNGPAMIRIEMVKVPGAGFSISELSNGAFAVTLRPSKDGIGAITLSDYAAETTPNKATVPIKDIKCNETYQSGEYQCNITITYDEDTLDLTKDKYYIKVTALYRDARISLGYAKDSNDNQLRFNGIQPLIDVTGRVNNTYRRVVARVATNAAVAGELFFPEYAIESATKICKKMRIVQPGSVPGSQDECNYSTP
jgi:hypothetical protein